MVTKKTSGLLLAGLIVLITLFVATLSSDVAVGQTVPGGNELEPILYLPLAANVPPVTYDAYSPADIPTLDPQLAEDITSVDYIENLFVNLTNYDPDADEIVAEAATGWTVSGDGLRYTFNIRSDIPWVKYDPTIGEAVQEVDGTSQPFFVTAPDFVYGIKRMCNPNTASYYSGVLAPVISGCADVLTYPDPDNIPPSLIDAIGASAPASDILVVDLEFPAGYFLTMTSMWPLAATPQWAIETHGDAWIEANNIVTNGRFVLTEWTHDVSRTLERNPLLPVDMEGSGNIRRIVTTVVPDTATGYDMWLDNQVDLSGIPDAELQGHLDTYPDETDKIPDLAVFYFGYRTTKWPMNNVHLRRAFSAAFDRQTFLDDLRDSQGYPMKHFGPPGIFGSPPIDDVGVGYDPSFAASEMAAAGYPNCDGLPTLTVMGYSGQSTLDWLQYAQAQWQTNLGCDPGQFDVVQVNFSELLDATAPDTPDSEAPHLFTLGWGPDYPDENNYVGDVLWCQTPNRFKRACSNIDNLITQAREGTDPATRITLYNQIEDGFFGETGEFPMAPLFLRAAYVARHSWVTRTPVLYGGEQWYEWQIDWIAKLSAQGG